MAVSEVTSTGRTFRFSVTLGKEPPQTQNIRPVQAVRQLKNGNWHDLKSPQEIGVEEAKLFDTPGLQMIYAVLRHVPGDMLARVAPAAANRKIPGGARIVKVQANCTNWYCRANCNRITLLPIFFCFDNAWPDNCPCPKAIGYWYITCCGCYYAITCLVPCPLFGCDA